MDLIASDLSREKLYDFLNELHDISFEHKDYVNYSHKVQRICKCANFDIKLTIRMYITHVIDPENNFKVTVKTTLSGDSVTLRKAKTFFNDYESFILSKESIGPITPEDKERIYTELVDEIIHHLNTFKVCKQCRVLYKDPRIKNNPNHPCINCQFDQIFQLRDAQCMVCNEVILPDDLTFTLTCAHTFHTPCIMMGFIHMKKRECPLCREVDQHEAL
jgi:hypothetical protein